MVRDLIYGDSTLNKIQRGFHVDKDICRDIELVLSVCILVSLRNMSQWSHTIPPGLSLTITIINSTY